MSRTVTFTSVMNGVLSRMGLDPTITPAGNVLAAFTEYINSAVRSIWETYPWPDAIRYETRQFYPSWSSSTNYAAASVVLGSDGTYYYALQASLGVDPTTDTTDLYWISVTQQSTPVLFAISLDQAGQTPIGEVLQVYWSDPRFISYARPLPWELTANGIEPRLFAIPSDTSDPIPTTQYPGGIPSTLCVKFTTRPPQFTTASFSNGDTMPYVIAEGVKYLACGCALREDGQFDKAAAMDTQAEAYFDLEIDKIEMKQGQQRMFSVLQR
jgi:hypothetical protein